MNSDGLSADISRVALLDDPVRRALYLFVVDQPDDVGRDQAARAVRVSRALAAFHLDRLVDAGLLESGFRQAPARTKRAGRPPKVYRRAPRQIDLTLPRRQYGLVAELMAASIDDQRSSAAAKSLRRRAGDVGRSLGELARRRAGKRPARRNLVVAAEGLLREHGFAPFRAADGALCLRNCPFDALVAEHRDLVCGMNVELNDGLLEGLGLTGVRASFEPTAGRCCVVLRERAA
jgi:predicted ArsR family transcriptional regulator